MLCAISGTTPEEPVITKSGNVYERRLIEKAIDTTGKDPATGEPLAKEDLIAVKLNKTVKPRPVTATSIPSMLQLFQNEWDALMLETHTLKQHLDTVRQELAHALYQHDAACRVIARLIKERDAARSGLASLQGSVEPQRAGGDAMEVDHGGMTEAIKEKIQQKSQVLSRDRKKRQISPDLASEDAIKGYKATASHTGMHKSNPPGITSLDIHPTNQHLILTGGNDNNAVLFNTQSGKIVATLAAHTKRVNDVAFHPTDEIVISASGDRTAKVWRKASETEWTVGHTIKAHSNDVTGVSVHSTGDYVATSSNDFTWGFTDIRTGQTIVKGSDANAQSGYSSISFHPDGLLLGTGLKDSTVRVWDVRAQTNVATFEGHNGDVEGLAFSENGYFLATAGGDSVKLWDLRKLKNFHTIPLQEVRSVAFDFSGHYLAVANANTVSIFGGKTFAEVHTFTEHTNAVTDVRFGKDAKWFASSSNDRSLKIYAQ